MEDIVAAVIQYKSSPFISQFCWGPYVAAHDHIKQRNAFLPSFTVHISRKWRVQPIICMVMSISRSSDINQSEQSIDSNDQSEASLS